MLPEELKDKLSEREYDFFKSLQMISKKRDIDVIIEGEELLYLYKEGVIRREPLSHLNRLMSAIVVEDDTEAT